ncbi:MAG: peptidase S41, partial [Caulobacterales bacterium 32-67-6]
MNHSITEPDRAPLDAVLLYVLTGLLALGAIFATAFSDDRLFRFHGYLLIGAFTLAFALLTVALNSGRLRSAPDRYADGVIRAGVIATMFWAVVGLLVGVVIAAQLAWPNVMYFPEHGWLNFGRLRPLHTSGVIFAFGGNALIATSLYVVQRTSKARLAGGVWPWFVFWGYQLFIVLAATGYLAGITQSREYAEPEWYV